MPGTSDPRVASPISTGGGGTFFEQHVNALFLALLLVRAPLPILKDCQIDEVQFQTERLGWETDDILVTGVRADSQRRRLAAQVKRQFTISKTNENCTKAFRGFWADFCGQEFDRNNDRLALITLRGTNALLETLNSLLNCARASLDAEDFAQRLQTPGLISKNAKAYVETIREILEEINGSPPTDEEYWRFLSVLHILSFDLNTDSAQTESWVKTLLAYSTNGGGGLEVANQTWSELLALVGAGMPEATGFRYQNLPENLRQRHGPIDTRASQIVNALSAHSAVTLNGIRTTIGATAGIRRDAIIDLVFDALSAHQVVLISAPAGFGKSALAKVCVESLSEDLYCLTFRAEEFATTHIDHMLHQAQVPVRGSDLLGILAGQGKKLIHVESVERLLEASVRGAFADLLGLAQRDKSLGLLLTCRDYSLETVGTALLGRTGMSFKVIEIPPLTDEELEQAVALVPTLANALEHEDLKRLLRSPYLLDKAADLDWSGSVEFPANEWEFRKRCWGELIRRNATVVDGLPQRRESVFEEVALRRARQLRPFVAIQGLDVVALEALKRDGLIVASPTTDTMVAPSHDVLEDWAIIQWLDNRWALHEGSPALLAADVSSHPAIRRAYRKWLSELLIRNSVSGTGFVISVIRNSSLPAYFRDDTLVCALQSSSVRDFLEQHRGALFASEGRLLVRMIHLLRVACKRVPWWLRDTGGVPSHMLVPSGEAWPAVLELVLAGIDELLPQHIPIILGLIEDFVRSIDWRDLEPNGFQEVAKIAFSLLRHLNGYRSDELRKRTLKVIAKVPRGDANAFQQLVEGVIENEHGNWVSGDVSKILLGGMEGWTACRYFPEEIIRLAKSSFLFYEEDLDEDDRRRGALVGIELSFGMQENFEFESFPPSSLRGVFFPLLLYHPSIAVDFLIELLNHAGTWYGEGLWPYDRLEPAHPITIDLLGADTVTQWGNPRLWCLYRGISVGPNVLQSALMALESWLLDLCKKEDAEVEPWLLRLLKESNNIMATAIVASVCNAHPEKAGNASLALLSSRELIEMDRARKFHERGDSSLLGRILPIQAGDEIYQQERKQSDSLAHRKYDLEALAVRLQLTERRENVFAIIDRYRAELPPPEEQSEEHRVWRLSLHRMDLRGYRPAQESESVQGNDCESDEDGEQHRQIVLTPGEVEEDVQEMIERHAPIAARQEREFSLFNWGSAAWEGRDSSHPNSSDWETFLARARDCDAEPEPDGFIRGAPSTVAAVCVRDHWEEMGPEDRNWCLDKLVTAIEEDCDSEDELIRVSRGAPKSDRYAAYALPGLLCQDVSETQAQRIKECIAKALTHAADEVTRYAAEGVGAYLVEGDRSFSESCVAAMAARARLISVRLAEERAKPYDARVDTADIVRDLAPDVRTAINNQSYNSEEELQELDLVDWPGREAARKILTVLEYQLDSVLAIQFFRRIVTWLVGSWDENVEGRRRHRDYEFQYDFLRQLVRFLLKLTVEQALEVCEPLILAVSSHPREVAHFVQDLISEEDRRTGESPFWPIWQVFANAIYEAPWIGELDERYGSGKDLMYAIFLNGNWKKDVRHWRKLDGEGHRIDELAIRFHGSSVVFESYCRFLYHIGENSLPGAFVILADSLSAGAPISMLEDQNTVYLIESLLQRYVYAEPHRLKSDPHIRTAVLAILDHLVEAGSSAAYRMRDDFVTPASGTTGD